MMAHKRWQKKRTQKITENKDTFGLASVSSRQNHGFKEFCCANLIKNMMSCVLTYSKLNTNAGLKTSDYAKYELSILIMYI